MLCITKPPPKESIAKSPDNLPTIFFDVGDRVCVKGFDLGFCFSSLSKSFAWTCSFVSSSFSVNSTFLDNKR
jgi:hypothetical protein